MTVVLTKIQTVLIILTIILLSALCVLLYTVSGQKDTLSLSLQKSDVQNANLSASVAQLNSRLQISSSEKSALVSQLEQVTAERDSARKQVDDADLAIGTLNFTVSAQSGKIESLVLDMNSTKNSLDDFERQVNQSMQWFKDNSNITPVMQFHEIQNRLDSFCIDVNGDTCRIKLACPRLVNDEYSQFQYKTDEELFGKADKLQSLEEFAQNRGGDCEDYSLAVKAELNFLVQKCGDRGLKKIEFEPVVSDQGQQYTIKYDPDSTPPVTWYYENTAGLPLSLDYSNYNVVCGTFAAATDASAKTVLGGHCLLGFSKIKIANSSDIFPAITDAYYVEPQNGYVVDTTGYIKPQSGQTYPRDFRSASASIWAIITGDDYYLYIRQENGTWVWRGYKDIFGQTEAVRMNLEKILAG